MEKIKVGDYVTVKSAPYSRELEEDLMSKPCKVLEIYHNSLGNIAGVCVEAHSYGNIPGGWALSARQVEKYVEPFTRKKCVYRGEAYVIVGKATMSCSGKGSGYLLEAPCCSVHPHRYHLHDTKGCNATIDKLCDGYVMKDKKAYYFVFKDSVSDISDIGESEEVLMEIAELLESLM